MLLDLVKKLLCLPVSLLWTKHVVTCMHLEEPVTWQHGGVLSFCVGFLEKSIAIKIRDAL